MIARLLTIEDAAKMLGVPKGSLKSEAEKHGYIVKMGRHSRINPNDLEDLIRQCQDNQKARTYTSVEPECGLSGKETNSNQRALETADKLKRLSPGTSQSETGPPAQVHRIK